MGKYRFLMLIIAAVLVSCERKSAVREILSDAETLMNERPDSSLYVLQSIDSNSLKSKRLKAEYSLLLSMALDKNYIDLTSDSLINNAVTYYRRHKDYERQFLSLFYHGRIKYNARELNEAILSYTKAELIIDKVNNNHYKGLLYANLGGVYEKCFDYLKFLEASKKAEEYYAHAGSIAHQYYAKLSIGKAHVYMDNYEEAEGIVKEVLEWGLENKDYAVCIEGRKLYFSLLMISGRVKELLDLFSMDEINSYDPLSKSYLLAYQSALEKDRIKTAAHLDSAWTFVSTAQDTVAMYNNGYKINKILGDYSAALDEHEKLLIAQDAIIRSTLRQPLLEVQRDYFHSQSENHALRLRVNRILLASGCIIVVLLLILVMAYYRHLLVRKQRNLDDYMMLYHELEEKMSEKDSKIDNIYAQVRKLFSTQYDLLDQLCRISYENPGSNRTSAICSKVAKEIDAFKSDSRFYDKLEKIVNEYNNDVMRKLREGVPNLKQQEYRMFCFYCAGFSTKTISIFIDEPLENIYMKKKRLKEKIMKQMDQNSLEIIQYLE